MTGSLSTLRSFDQIKILADSRRLEILRRLMAAPATLTQIGAHMGHTAAWVHHHLQVLVAAGLVEPAGSRLKGRATEKYYRARADALLLEQLVLPRSHAPVIVFAGSHDLALQKLAGCLAARQHLLPIYVGSLNGLIDLHQGLCQVSGSHLLDENGDYNTSFVRHIFADRDVQVMTLAYRTQGLMLAPGNPKSVHGLHDLMRPHLRFVNRNRGSGTRLWVEGQLRRESLDAGAVSGWNREVTTHTEAAALIKAAKADAAVGLQAAALESGLDFVPLFEERYDLIMPREGEKLLGPLLDCIQTRGFRAAVAPMAGYSTAHSGEQIPI